MLHSKIEKALIAEKEVFMLLQTSWSQAMKFPFLALVFFNSL